MLWSMAQLRRGQLRMVVDVVGSCWWCGQLSVLARHTHMLHCPPVPTSSWKLCIDRPQWNNICYWGDSAIVWLRHLDSRETIGLFSSTANLTNGVHWDGQQQVAEGREWSGGDGSGVEGRGGQGRAGQGARLLRWTFTGRDFIPLNTPVERAAT